MADIGKRQDKMMDYFEFLEKHRDELMYAKKGYLQRLRDIFEEEYHYNCSISWIQRWLCSYRRIKECPLNYCENKYYKPHKGASTIFVPKELQPLRS